MSGALPAAETALPSPDRAEGGFAMIELVVAMMIFGLVATAALGMFSSSARLTASNRLRVVAANLAARQMDVVRTTDFTNLTIGVSTSTQAVDNVTFTIAEDNEWVNGTIAGSGGCSVPATSTTTMMRVAVSVTWPNMFGVPAVRSDTLIAPPTGAANPGNIAVRVVDRNAAGEAGLVVTLNGPGGTKTGTTGSDGCAVFTGLTAGSYTASLSAVGYVDDQGNATPSTALTLIAGQNIGTSFTYDRAGTLALTLAGDAGGTVPNNIAVALGSTHFLPAGVKLYAGTGTSRTVSNLFPFVAGYQAWGGDCADADPEGHQSNGQAYYSGGQRAAPISTTPGATTNGSVVLKSVIVQVRRVGLGVSGQTLTFTHGTDAGCAAGEVLTAGPTDAQGNFTVALPYGTWTVAVQGGTPATSWPITTLNPTVSGTPTVVVNLMPIPSCVAPPTTLTSTADAQIRLASSNTNYGTDPTRFGVRSSSGDDRRSLVQFTLPVVPTGCSLISAQLRVWTTSGTSGRTLQAFQLSGSWTETGVTWSNQPATTGSAATAPSASSSAWVSWTVSSIVQAMYSGTNRGFLLRDSSEGSSSQQDNQMTPREGGANAPQLVLTWG